MTPSDISVFATLLGALVGFAAAACVHLGGIKDQLKRIADASEKRARP